MFRHHGDGSRRHDLPGERARIELPPLWASAWLATQPNGDPVATGTTPPAGTVTLTTEQLSAMIEDRLARDRAARPAAPADLAQLREKAGKYDTLAATAETDQSRAVAEARTAAAAEARAALLPRLVSAEMRLARPGLTTEQADALLAPLNMAYFAGADGAVDPTKVTAYAATLPGGVPAPIAGDGAPGTPPGTPGTPAGPPALPPLGQGGGTTPPPSAAQAGKDRAASQFGTDRGPGRPTHTQ